MQPSDANEAPDNVAGRKSRRVVALHSRHVKQGIWCSLVHNGAMNTTTSPPLPQTIRLTIPVSVEVHDTFKRIAKASKMPIGRAMAEWLGDTIDAAEFVAQTMEKARIAPRLAVQELQAYALGLADETGDVLAKMRQKGTQDRKAAAAGVPVGSALAGPKGGTAAAAGSIPPSCNTGGKVPAGDNNVRTPRGKKK